LNCTSNGIAKENQFQGKYSSGEKKEKGTEQKGALGNVGSIGA